MHSETKDFHYEIKGDLACEDCDYKTYQKFHLKLHIKRVHGHMNDNPYKKCKLCEFEADTEGEIKQHLLATHVNVR